MVLLCNLIWKYLLFNFSSVTQQKRKGTYLVVVPNPNNGYSVVSAVGTRTFASIWPDLLGQPISRRTSLLDEIWWWRLQPHRKIHDTQSEFCVSRYNNEKRFECGMDEWLLCYYRFLPANSGAEFPQELVAKGCEAAQYRYFGKYLETRILEGFYCPLGGKDLINSVGANISFKVTSK